MSYDPRFRKARLQQVSIQIETWAVYEEYNGKEKLIASGIPTMEEAIQRQRLEAKKASLDTSVQGVKVFRVRKWPNAEGRLGGNTVIPS